jgi:hypothetical protein
MRCTNPKCGPPPTEIGPDEPHVVVMFVPNSDGQAYHYCTNECAIQELQAEVDN